MTSPYGPILVISNPAAGRGRGAVLPRLLSALEERGLDASLTVTGRRGDAERTARDAVTRQGIRYLVVVGGDGTVHEVVNGLIAADTGQPVAPDVVVGVVAAGSGCDLIRTFGLDRSPEKVAKHLEGDAVFPIDVGRARLLGRDGQPTVRLFANIAEVGYGASVVDAAERLPRWLGQARYLVAIFATLRRLQPVDMTVAVEHTDLSESLSNIVVANGQFFGGGMKVAPRALPDDGLFNVQAWRGGPKDAFAMTPKVRRGDHLGSGEVREYQSATVRVDSDAPLLVEADGDVLGTTPVEFDLLPRILNLKI